ncbi:inositol monophosphatase, partial [Candidatus Sumerlaeota bacterium]|nr:inositol monophosphatase [Candidatus Sumerlaeota bacterium]
LLVTEAGGAVSDYRGNRVDLFRPGVVAANPRIHKLMLAVIKKAMKGYSLDALR